MKLMQTDSYSLFVSVGASDRRDSRPHYFPLCLRARECVFVCLHVCMCFHVSEKLLSDTAVPLFPSHTPTLAQLPLAARSHDPPMLLPAFTFSSAWLASEKQRPAPSPTQAFLLSIVGRPANTSPRPGASPGALRLTFSKTDRNKGKRCRFLLHCLGLLMNCLRPTGEEEMHINNTPVFPVVFHFLLHYNQSTSCSHHCLK